MTDTEALISVAEALDRLLEEFRPAGIEVVELDEATSRVLASPILAPFDYPRYYLSSMDGYAVRAVDVATASDSEPAMLEVIEDIPAGLVPTRRVEAGSASRIMTGAVLPDGADAVVPVEQTDDDWKEHLVESYPASINVFGTVAPGDYVRKPGEDFKKGNLLLSSRRLKPQDIGLLAMVGVGSVEVVKRPKVALISTGDELLPVDAPLTAGKIYDTNTYTLASLVSKYGGEVVFRQIARDREADVREVLDAAVAANPHVIISSAGVSVGAFDYVRKVVEQGGGLKFWRVNMRPGKPLAFGHYRGLPFIGLPGNPVSAFVGFEVFVRPVLDRLSGITGGVRSRVKVQLEETITSDGRESYLRAQVTSKEGIYFCRLTGHQGSGNLLSLVHANALLVIPSGVKSLPAGSQVYAWLLNELV
jgi:molybdopterin molybdotransferase